jgi:hypothetical protein
MAEIPRIAAATPFVVPAVGAKAFNDAALLSLVMATPPLRPDRPAPDLSLGQSDLDGQTVSVTFGPYNFDTKQLPPSLGGPMGYPMPGQPGQPGMPLEVLPAINIWDEKRRSTLFAQVMEGVLTYSLLHRQELALLKQIAAFVSVGADHSALDTQLAAVHTQMGVTG